MATYHFHLQIIGRASGRSTVATSAYTSGSSVKVVYVRSIINSAAYRASEKLEDISQNITHDFTRKSGVVYSDILLPENAPESFKDRQTLWNAVEQKENRSNSRFAREIDVSLPREFDLDEQKQVLKEYVTNNFVKEGMCADISIHDKGDGNPHAHILLTVRDVDKNGFKEKHDKSRKEWNKTENMEKWRREWAEVNNKKFAEKGLDIRIGHRSYEKQGIDRIPTIALGHKSHKLEQKGIKTERGNINREIIKQNLNKEKSHYIDLTKKMSDTSTQQDVSYKKIQEIKPKVSESNTSIDTSQLRHELQVHKTAYERQAEEINHLQKQRKSTELEYKKLKYNAERYYFFEKGEVNNAVKPSELPREINERLLIIQAESKLNTITKEEYREIAFERERDMIRDLELIR